MCVPTSSRVSRVPEQQLGPEAADGLAQAVPDLLEAAGQPRVVEREADVVLDDPQPLGGAVGRGVEDAAEVDPLARLGQLQGRDLGGDRDRLGLGRGGPRQPVGQLARRQAGGGQRLGDRARRGEQARQQVLGADRLAPVERPRLDRRVVQRRADGRRLRQRRGLRRGRDRRGLGAGAGGLGAEHGPDPLGAEPVLAEQLGGAALGLVDQRGEQVGRLDGRPAPAPGPRLGPLQRPQCAGGE